MTTRVIHIRDAPPGWEADPQYQFVGRPRKGHDGYFGNPYPLGKGQPLGSSLARYKAYLEARLASDDAFRRRVAALYGKTLVCYCKPHICHGDLLAAAAERLNNPAMFKTYKARVKFGARPSPKDSNVVDMVVVFQGGRTEKIFGSAEDTRLAQYKPGDQVVIVEYPTQGNGMGFALADDQSVLSPNGSRFHVYTEEELQEASQAAKHHVLIVKEMFRNMLGVSQDDLQQHITPEVAQALTATAFIQTFGRK